MGIGGRTHQIYRVSEGHTASCRRSPKGCECDGKRRRLASFTRLAVGRKNPVRVHLPIVDINVKYSAKIWGTCWIREVMGLDA
jgi:hypothetical protein